MTQLTTNAQSGDPTKAAVTCHPGREFAVDIGWARQDNEEVEMEKQAIQERGAARLIEVLRALVEFGENFLRCIASDTYRVGDSYIVGDKFSADHIRRALSESRGLYRRCWTAMKTYSRLGKKRRVRVKTDLKTCIASLRSTRNLYQFLHGEQTKPCLSIPSALFDDNDLALDVLRRLMSDLEHVLLADEFGAFVPAYWLSTEHGIDQPRLSDAKKSGKVRTKKALPGYPKIKGKTVRVLYNRNDAIRHCAPKRTGKSRGRYRMKHEDDWPTENT